MWAQGLAQASGPQSEPVSGQELVPGSAREPLVRMGPSRQVIHWRRGHLVSGPKSAKVLGLGWQVPRRRACWRCLVRLLRHRKPPKQNRTAPPVPRNDSACQLSRVPDSSGASMGKESNREWEFSLEPLPIDTDQRNDDVPWWVAPKDASIGATTLWAKARRRLPARPTLLLGEPGGVVYPSLSGEPFRARSGTGGQQTRGEPDHAQPCRRLLSARSGPPDLVVRPAFLGRPQWL